MNVINLCESLTMHCLELSLKYIVLSEILSVNNLHLGNIAILNKRKQPTKLIRKFTSPVEKLTFCFYLFVKPDIKLIFLEKSF